MAHTPGPWTVFQGYIVTANADGSVPIGSRIVTPLGAYIAASDGHEFMASDDDARLLAAAPDLLNAIERSLSWLSSYPGGGAQHAYEIARAALAKARGMEIG